MTVVTAVTTFNEAGLLKYGKRMMRSFADHWSMGVWLHVYFEGWSPWSMTYEEWNRDDPLEFRELLDSSDWLARFKQRHAHRDTRNFRLDAVRFSHKIVALVHAAETNRETDYLLWIDGDVITHSDFDKEHLDTLLPAGDELVAWLNRDRFYPECGFYIINCNHVAFPHLIQQLRFMYDGDGLFNLKEWHDSYVFEQVVKALGAKAKSLSGAGSRTHHPLVNGPLGQWFDHLKGARKEKGKSLRSDFIKKRPEKYWQ